MSRRATVVVARNFERNLESISEFLDESDRAASLAALLDELFDVVVARLSRFPRIGADFLARQPASVEGVARWTALRERLGADCHLRQYLTEEYLYLYALRADVVSLLAIKHHRQLSFDLKENWAGRAPPAPRGATTSELPAKRAPRRRKKR